jgi:hypothetical protein
MDRLKLSDDYIIYEQNEPRFSLVLRLFKLLLCTMSEEIRPCSPDCPLWSPGE